MKKIAPRISKNLHQIFKPINPTQKENLHSENSQRENIRDPAYPSINNKTKIVFYYSITSLIR